MQTIKKIYKRLIEKELFKYLAIGGVAFVVDYLALLTAYYVFKFPLVIASSVGFLCGFLISYSANRFWVFGNSGAKRSPKRQLIEYGLLVGFNYAFTVFSLHYLLELGVKPEIGKLIIMSLIVVWNFVIFKTKIFSDTEKEN